MQAIVLLIFVIISAFLFKKEKSPYVRIIIGSVFGMAFFSFWPITVFYIDIHHLRKTPLIIIYVIIAIFSLVLSYLLIYVKKEVLVSSVMFLLFIFSTIFSVLFESEIKNTVSINTGYFSDKEPANKIHYDTSSLKQRNNFTSLNYTYSLHTDWKIKIEKGPLFYYYILSGKDHNIAELRPKCFNTSNISLAEIVSKLYSVINTKKTDMNKICYKTGDEIYACKVIAIDAKKQVQRIRWYSMNTEIHYGIELDFLLYDNKPSTEEEIEKIIRSAKYNFKNDKDMNCLGLTEWM
ncbi:MAG: hypothetical protein QM484_06635 [Woeseiaceae bacterium]